MKKQNGMTLLEIIFSIAVAAILIGVGVPSFVDSIRNSEMVTASNVLVGAMHAARAEAVKSQQLVTLCRGTDDGNTQSCDTSGNNILVFQNQANDATFDNVDVLIQSLPWLSDNYTVSQVSIPDYISFSPQGFTRRTNGNTITGSITLCGPAQGKFGRIVSISRTGRPSIEKVAAQATPSCT